MWLKKNVIKAICYQGKMLLRQNVTEEKWTRQNVTKAKCD